MKADTLFYRLFQRWPKLALELLGLEYRSESYRFGSEEIKQTAFRLDGLFSPTEGNAEQPLIFFEVKSAGRRFLRSVFQRNNAIFTVA